MTKIYDAITVAKWIINEIHPEPLKLQKLLYFAQGYSYAFNDRPLFYNNIESWIHGPVIPKIYHLYAKFQYHPIMICYKNIKIDKDTEEILKYVINKYAKYDSKYLEKITHNEEPWLVARNKTKINEKSTKIISKESIANFYTNDIFSPSDEEWDL